MQQKIRSFIEERGISQAQLAREIGKSTSAFSAYLNGVYKGDNSAIERDLKSWLENFAKKQKQFVEAPQFIETATAKQIWNTLEFAKLLGSFSIVYGASGVGKTRSAQEYKRENANVWFITASPAKSSLSEILYEIALELNISDAPRRKAKLSRLINKKLSNTNGLMIIDEADHLPYDALEELRIIQEETQIGFVLIGNDKVYNRIRGGANQQHEFARLWSRVAKKTSIQKSKKADVKAIAEAWNLDFANKDLMTSLYEIGTSAGGLRALTQYLRLAGMTAKAQERLIDLNLILQAKKELDGED